MATRNYWLHPGGPNCVWNTPLGDGCVWGTVSDADTQDLRHGGFCNSADNYGLVVWVSNSASDPTASFTGNNQNYETGNTNVSVTAHLVPGSYSAGPHPQGDQGYSFFDLVGHPNMAYGFGSVDIESFQAGQGPFNCFAGYAEDATSDNFATDWETGFAGVNTTAGCIRGYDLDPTQNAARIPGTSLPRIQHMLRYMHDQAYFKSNIQQGPNYPQGGKLNPNGWPNLYQDWQQPGLTYTGNLLFGTTVGIPMNVARPAGLTNAGIQIWDCLQTYGAIPRDQAAGGFHISVDQTVSATWINQANTDLPKIVQYLCPLRNQHQGGQDFATHPANGPGNRLDSGPPPLAGTTTPPPESANNTVITLTSGGSIIDANGVAWMLTSNGQVQKGGVVDTTTSNVIELAYVNHVVWYETSANVWRSWNGSAWTPSGGTTTSPLPASPGGGTGGGTGAFSVANGQVIGPNGAAFCAAGINMGDADMASAVTNAACQPMTTLFPGINFVRVACYAYNAPSYYQTFINRCTAAKIVVLLENHQTSTGNNSGGADGVVFTGSLLSDESTWYANLAAAYKGNPYVWFGTNNEPPYSPISALSSWHQATYNAIRTQGANNIILVDLPGGGVPNTYGSGSGMTASVYAAMTNIVWDFHQYAWAYGGQTGSVTEAAIESQMRSWIATAKTLPSKDGTVPVIIGEYGPCTNGISVDISGTQLVAAVLAVSLPGGPSAGSAAWHWGTIDAGNNLSSSQSGGTLTSYGQTVAAYIAKAASTAPAGGGTTFTPSANNTVVTAGSNGSITDASGNVWTITSGGQVARNGVTDTSTSSVIELAYVNNVVWYENSSGLWRSWSAGTPPTVLTPTSGGSIKDSAGNMWTMDSGGSVYENGTLVPGSGGTGQFTIVGGAYYGQDSSTGNWYTYSPSTQQWTSSAAPDLSAPSGWAPTAGTSTSPLPTTSAPTTPVISAGTATTTSVPLTWTSGGSGVTYQVQYKLHSATTWTNFGSGTASLSATVTGLTSASTYDFRVTATNSVGTVTSAPISAITASPVVTIVAPSAPTGVTASNITGTSMDVSWTAPASGTPPFDYQPQYQAHAAAATPPPAPSVTVGTVTASSVALSWTSSGSGASYAVNYKAHSATSWTNATTTSALSATVSNLTASTAYDFQVVATLAGLSATSATVSATTAAATGTGTGTGGTPTRSAADIVAYLKSISGSHSISGQYIEFGPLTPVQTVFNNTGKWLGLIGINYWGDGDTSATANTSAHQIAINYWNAGGLVILNLFIPNPTTGGSERDISALDASGIVSAGTSTNTKFNSLIDSIASGLSALQSAGVTVIIRPFLENNGNWFWWGANMMSASQFIAMWRYFYNRITVTHGLKNCVWLYAINAGTAQSGRTMTDTYPGDAYVDMTGQDLYTSDPTQGGLTYDTLLSIAPGKPTCLAEFGSGGPSQADTSFNEAVLISAIKSRMPKVVLWQQWWTGGYPYQWGIEMMQNQGALTDPWVLNRGDLQIGATGSPGGGTTTPPTFTESPDQTVVTPGSGKSITDSTGNIWTITTGAQVAVNGVPDGTTSAVTELAYVSHIVWQENSSGLWWSWSGGAWSPPAGTSTSPLSSSPGGTTTSPNDSVVLAGTTGAITDAAGNKWTITSGGQVAINGVPDSTTSNVIELAYVNGVVWQENNAGLWYGKSSPSAAWSPAAGTTTSPLPAPGGTGSDPGTGSPGGTTTGGGTRVTAPLTGSVTTGRWVVNQRIAVGAMPNGFMSYNYLLPQGYDPNANIIYPILFYGHENDEGMANGSYPVDGSSLVSYEADGAFNTVAFRTNFPCIVVVPACDQSIDGSGANPNANFGGYADTPNSGGNEQAINALLRWFIANFKVDVTRCYACGSSLGAIGSLAWLIDNNRYNGINKLWTAAMGYSEQHYRPTVNGGDNTSIFGTMRNVPYIAVSTPYDNSPASYDEPAWRYYTGNSNYPTESSYQNGGVAAIKAGSASYWYIRMTSGTNPWDAYRRLNADGQNGTALYTLLFSFIAP